MATTTATTLSLPLWKITCVTTRRPLPVRCRIPDVAGSDTVGFGSTERSKMTIAVWGATGSTLTHLEGALSGKTYPADGLIGLDPADGRPLLARYDLERATRTLTAESLAARRTGGLWRWAELLPVRDRSNVVYLGEGDTPLLPQPRLGEAFGVPRLATKAEGLNPTGSFKARGMAVAVSRAAELGVTSFIAPSAGNAAGAKVTVLTPVDATVVHQQEVLAMGARLVLVRGLISDCGKISSALAPKIGAFDVSTLKEPYRVEGKKTM